MPGKGKPFVKGDPRQKPGPGRPKEAYLEGLRRLEPLAFEAVEKHLRKGSLMAALAVLDRLHGKPKETVTVEGDVQHVLLIPDALWKRFRKDGDARAALPAPQDTEKA